GGEEPSGFVVAVGLASEALDACWLLLEVARESSVMIGVVSTFGFRCVRWTLSAPPMLEKESRRRRESKGQSAHRLFLSSQRTYRWQYNALEIAPQSEERWDC